MLKKDPFQQTGKEIYVSPIRNPGYVNYRVRFSMEVHVENEPKFKCKIYDENDSYSKCLEKQYIEKILEKLGCIPPWLGDASMWCNSTFSGINGDCR